MAVTTIRVGCGSPDGVGGALSAHVLQAVAGEGADEHVGVEWADDVFDGEGGVWVEGVGGV